MPRVHDDNDTQAQKTNLQKAVLAYLWCTFHRARRYFSSAIEAITRDLFINLDISLSSADQMRFDQFIAPNFPACCSTFQARALDGSHLTLEYPGRLATALLMTNLDRSDSRLATPNLKVAPTAVLAVPEYVLVGKPVWTEEKADLLQMLCSYVNLRSVQYELSAFHDTDITAWATHLFTCQESRDIDHTGFAQWVLDWSSQVRSSHIWMRLGGPRKVKRPLFRRGGVSRGRENGMARRFWEICGGRVEGFGKEVESVGRTKGWHCGGDVGVHVCSS